MVKNRAVKNKNHEYLFRKEIFALQNDLYYKFFENYSGKWYFDIAYKPYKTLSGDTYAIRQIGEGKFFIFLIDAMEKGLNASITSIMSATFINYLVEVQKEKKNFSLKNIIKQYFKYIQTSIFDDEIVSASFVILDLKNHYIKSAIFGIPPIFVQNLNGSLDKIKANNLPISKYSTEVNISTKKLTNAKKILIYSDGLNETIINDSYMYKEHMDEDFINATNHKDFLELAQNRVGKFDDDMTFIYIEREECIACGVDYFSIQSRQDILEVAIKRVEEFLLKNGLSPQNEAYLSSAFFEMLLNAYEHGNLKITHQEKSKHMESGTFDDILKERELLYGDKKIYINLRTKEEHNIKTFKIEVTDEGDGFDTSIMRNQYLTNKFYSGRGLVMASKMVDAFYYNHIGNKVILKKFQKQG